MAEDVYVARLAIAAQWAFWKEAGKESFQY